MSFPEQPTTKNLSDSKELKNFPGFGSSMGGGNMITEKDPNFGGQGSDSEASHDVVAHKMTDFGDIQHTPDLPGPVTPESDLDTGSKGNGYTPSARTWKEI